MKIALFTPFNTQAAKSNLVLWEKSWPTKEKYETTKMAAGNEVPNRPWAFDRGNPKSLAGFTGADDKLYIVGHCAEGSPVLSDRADGKGAKIWAKDLLPVIRDELQLPSTFPGTIKLLACEGAAGKNKGFLKQLYMICKGTYAQAHWCGYTEVLQVGRQMHKVINTETSKITVGKHPTKANPNVGKPSASVAVWFCPNPTCKHQQKLLGPQDI